MRHYNLSASVTVWAGGCAFRTAKETYDGMATGSHRGFNEQARLKAIETKRVRALEAPDDDAPTVFVVRVENGYGWEVRRYGAIVLDRGGVAYPGADEAREAGRSALGRLV